MSSFRSSAICGSLLELWTGLILPPTYRLKECPTAHVQVKIMSEGSHLMYGMLNVGNVVRRYLVMERLKWCPGVDLIFHLLYLVTAVYNITSNQCK